LLEETAAVESQPDYAHPKYSPGSRTAPTRTTDYLQGMVVALDPASGDVRAFVGGRDYGDSQFDRAVDGMRQPGSSFKPIVYAAAIADSITPITIFSDTALSISLPNGTVYRPEDSDGQYLGPLTLRDALARSRNVVAVQLGMKLGMDSIASLARRMGLSSKIAPYPSSAIGASVVQPLDLIAAYTALITLADALAEPKASTLLQRNLKQEIATLERATRIASRFARKCQPTLRGAATPPVDRAAQVGVSASARVLPRASRAGRQSLW